MVAALELNRLVLHHDTSESATYWAGPNVSPATKCFCMAKNMSTEGSAVRREPADTRLQAVVHCSFSADIGERYGFVNRSIPDAELDAFVDSLAERMGRFETRALATGKKMVNARAGVPSEGDLWTSNPAADGRIEAARASNCSPNSGH